ncbi:MAG: SoxR reducing system RseC family protein [Calditrichaeota bacterium]|nr:SoxR reducing system RseC family protein [Calditrichota bacterium]
MSAGRQARAGGPEVGTVVEVRGGRMVVRLNERAACAACGARFACTPTGQQSRHVTVPNQIGAKVGETVELTVRPRVSLLSVGLVFLLPVLLGMVGYFVVWGLCRAEKPAVLATMLGFALAFVVAWRVNRFLEMRQESPVRVRKVG